MVIDRVVSFPRHNASDTILLRNIGGRTANVTGWWMSDSRKSKSDPEAVYFFGVSEACAGFRGIPPAGVLELKPFMNANPCGFPFGTSYR